MIDVTRNNKGIVIVIITIIVVVVAIIWFTLKIWLQSLVEGLNRADDCMDFLVCQQVGDLILKQVTVGRPIRSRRT